MFFLGLPGLEIPGALIAERWSARRWIARIMISWGIILWSWPLSTRPGNLLIRFLVGAAERASSSPAVIVYISHWFRTEDRAKAVACFYAANLFLCHGSPLAGWLLGSPG